ncbi:MAG: OmpA family protein [Planctomycetota bacterium]|nr:OmpA family protein [Planctomycetota bacterium]
MNKSPLLFALALAFLPACQSNMTRQMIEDQDKQLAALNTERSSMQAQLSRTRAENASLAKQIEFEQQRSAELQQRASAAEAAVNQHDAEMDSLSTALQGTNIDIGRRGGFIVLGIDSELTFASGKAELSKQGRDTLTRVGDVLKSKYGENTIWIEGHTDNEQPKKSGWKSNLQLSAMRAMSCADYLIYDLGLDGSHVRVAGYGEFAPKAGNDTKEGRADNRRVEVLILGPAQ